MATNPSNTKSSLLLNASITFKLSRKNFCAWKHQVTTLLAGIEVMGHIDGTTLIQAETINNNGVSAPNPEYTKWFTLDQLIINLLLSSMTEADSISFASYETARTIPYGLLLNHSLITHLALMLCQLKIKFSAAQRVISP